MTDLIDFGLVPLIIVLLIGLIIAWLFLRGPREGGWHLGEARARGGGERPPETVEAPEEAAPPEEPAPAVPPAAGPADDLERLKGVGPRLAALLGEQGVTRYDQLAALDDRQLAALDAKLGNFKGRLARDRVREQAAYLARGDHEGFEAEFGKLGGAR
ncbi:MAG: hypothetical protein ACFBQW_03670 [Sphingomonadaceae bacterium]